MKAEQSPWGSQVDLRKAASELPLPRLRLQLDFLTLFPELLAAILLLSGLTICFGWLFSIEPLMNPFPGGDAIQPGSALGFVLSGIFLRSVGRPGKHSSWAARVSAIVLFAGSVGGLAAHILHWRIRLPIPAGAPSFFAGLCFSFLAGAMFLSRRNTSSSLALWRDVMVIAGTVIALLALLGYSCGVPSFYSSVSLFGGSSLPLETAVLLALLGPALLCVNVHQGLGKALTSRGASGTVLRRLILAPVLIPLVTGLLKSFGLHLGIYNPEFASWLFAASNIFILTLLICWSAKLLYHAETVRDRAEKALYETNEQLERRVRERTEELSAAEARFRTLVEQSLTGIYVIQEDRLAYVNPKMCEITGFTKDELTSWPLLSFIHPEDRPLVANNVRLRLEGKAPHIHYALRMLRKDGAVLHVEAYGAFCEYNDRPAVLGTLLDVTDRKRAEMEIRSLNADLERRVQERTRELALANKELEAFSYSVSHDLRAPLRHMGGFVQLLQKRAGASMDEKSHRYVKVISEAVTEMGTLIDNLLSFSRMGRAEMKTAPLDLNELVAEIITDFQRETAGREIRWLTTPLPRAQGDPALIRQVLVNLLSNAIKYTRTRTSAVIEIGCSQPEGTEQIFFVRDNGVGFDMQYASKLFGVFQRLHRAEEFEGTGIGLANVQRIIHRHGGRVWAEAELDRGATFYFSLPVA